MRKTALISLLVPVLLVTVGCSIEPPLHMRKTAQTQVVMQTNINTDVMWQANWQSEWDFAWNAAAHGPVGYSAPTGIRMHIFTLGPAGTPVQHHVYNFNGLSGSAEIFLGVHDFLIHNNGSEYVLFRANDDLSDIYAYTRTLSTAGLKSSIPIRTVSQTASPVSPTAPVATRAEEENEEDAATRDEDEEDPVEEINEPVVLAPDDLYVMYDPAHLISDDLSQYDLIDGTYVLRISGDMHPTTYIYLFQMRLINNYGRVVGSLGGAALTGMAESVNLHTFVTSDKKVSVPMDVYLSKADDPDLFGARVMTFGIPGCNPSDPESVAAAPEGKHYLVVNMNFQTGKYKNVRIDVTDLVRALPKGGVIEVDVDVNEFPPEEIDPPIEDEEGGGGFKALIAGWDEETASTTIIN